MAKGLFESPKKALLFVGMTLFSVAMLVGSEDDQGALVQAASSLSEPEPGAFDAPPQGQFGSRIDNDRDPYRDDAGDADFFADEELIDSAAGLDPTPLSTDPDMSDPADGDTYIISDDSDHFGD